MWSSFTKVLSHNTLKFPLLGPETRKLFILDLQKGDSFKGKTTVLGHYMLPEQPLCTLAMVLQMSEALLEGLKILPKEIPTT